MESYYTYVLLGSLAVVAAVVASRSSRQAMFEKLQIPWKDALILSNPVAQLVKQGYKKVWPPVAPTLHANDLSRSLASFPSPSYSAIGRMTTLCCL